MSTIAGVLVALVALEHLYILWIEMFAWTTKGKGSSVMPCPRSSSSPQGG